MFVNSRQCFLEKAPTNRGASFKTPTPREAGEPRSPGHFRTDLRELSPQCNVSKLIIFGKLLAGTVTFLPLSSQKCLE